jgi:hypothetical protein
MKTGVPHRIVHLELFSPDERFRYERLPVNIEWSEEPEAPRPRQAALREAGKPWLFRFVDPAGRWPVPGGAIPAGELGIRNDTASLQTDPINSAIAELSRSGGGTIHFEAGVYPVSTILMRSGVTLHLAAGGPEAEKGNRQGPDARLRLQPV